MPTDYTPNASNNPSVIHLPSDLDDNSAESVNAAFRALADRSAAIYNLVAQLSGSNTFTHTLFVSPVAEDEAALVPGRRPGQDASGNIWRLGLRLPIASSYNVSMYYGNSDFAGRFIITQNAKWDIPTQKWKLEDSSREASGLIWRFADMSWSYVAAGSADWDTWPTALPSGSNKGDVVAIGSFKYAESRARQSIIPLTTAAGAVTYNGPTGEISPFTLGDHSYIRFPVRVPIGATLSKITIMNYTAVAATETFRLVNRVATWDPFGPVAPTEVTVSNGGGPIQVTTSSSLGLKLTTLSCTGVTIALYDEMNLLWVPSAELGNTVCALLLDWNDVGPTPL